MTVRALQVQADLRFVSTAHDGTSGATGSVTADGRTIHVFLSDPAAGPAKLSRTVVRNVASSMAQRGLQLVLHGPRGVVLALGAVRTPLWQRLVTRSPYIQLIDLRAARRVMVRSSASRQQIRGPALWSAPSTPLPLFPTVSAIGPRPVTTTHDPRGGGNPRLVFSWSAWPQEGEAQRVAYLTRPRTTLGSASDCDVQIDGLEELHAVIDRTAQDEYVLTHVAPAGTSTVAGVPARRSLLRTGAALMLGQTQLTYFREEYADHGRPFGGRIGGELGHQRRQPRPRPRSTNSVGKPRTNRDPGQYFH
jgi:hypothetical protein